MKLVSPYLNNIHLEHHTRFTGLIEDIMQTAAIPLWQRVLSDLRWKERNSRLGKIDCIWEQWGKTAEAEESWNHYPYPPGDDDSDYDTSDIISWQLQHPELINLRDCQGYDGNIIKFLQKQKPIVLAGNMLQVIVKHPINRTIPVVDGTLKA